MVEDYWSEFCTWKDLTGYNKVALVSIFKRELHLVCKSDQNSILQEIPQLIIVYEICYNSPPEDFSEN